MARSPQSPIWAQRRFGRPPDPQRREGERPRLALAELEGDQRYRPGARSGDKFVLSVERMAWDDGSRDATRSLLSSPAKRMTLIADIVTEIQSRGVDGVSLDFEPILSDQRDNFADFVRQLRAALYVANPAYQLTFAATGSQLGQTYQMIGNVTASGAADAVLVMAYPLRGIDAKYAGGLSPLYSATSYDLKQITNAYLNQVAPDKIVMALPWYGREWPTVSRMSTRWSSQTVASSTGRTTSAIRTRYRSLSSTAASSTR